MNEQENPNTNNNAMNETNNKSLFDTNVANTYNNYSQNIEHLEPNKEEKIVEEESPFFTPVSIQPDVQENPELPEIVPNVTSDQPVSENMVFQEEAKQESMPIQEEMTETVATQTIVAPEPNDASKNVEVIETAEKAKTSNAILVVFLLLLIVFVYNIDTVISIINQYRKNSEPGSIANQNVNNLTDGYILIDDSTSSIKIKEIKFYNFRKSQDKGITFSYESLANYSDVSKFDIYIEIYNPEKEILYKELFNPQQKVEKDTVRTYVMDVDDIIFNNAFYAIVKISNENDNKDIKLLICTLDDGKYSYRNEYSFVGDGLSKYDVIKKARKSNDELLKKEYEELKKETNAKLDNNTLTYTIDLNKEYTEYIELYKKDSTLKYIKEKETLKEWKCE